MVASDTTSILEQLRSTPSPGHILVIDPDDQTPEMAAKRAIACVLAGTRCIFVGGSTAVDGTPVHDTVVAIQESLELVNGMQPKIPTHLKNNGTFQYYYFQQVLEHSLLQQMELHS